METLIPSTCALALSTPSPLQWRMSPPNPSPLQADFLNGRPHAECGPAILKIGRWTDENLVLKINLSEKSEGVKLELYPPVMCEGTISLMLEMKLSYSTSRSVISK